MSNQEMNMDKWDEIYEAGGYEIITQEVSDERQAFVIDNNNKAEWALNKIKEDRRSFEEYIETCDNMIKAYEEKKKKALEKMERKTSYLEYLLAQYFETVEKKKTKTQESYVLPSGKLVRKFGANDFQRDEEKLTKWLEDNKYNSFVKTEKKAAWGEFKKECTVSGDILVDKDGQIVEGVTILKKPDTFEVVVEKE